MVEKQYFLHVGIMNIHSFPSFLTISEEVPCVAQPTNRSDLLCAYHGIVGDLKKPGTVTSQSKTWRIGHRLYSEGWPWVRQEKQGTMEKIIC